MTSPVVCSIKHLSAEDKAILKPYLSDGKTKFPDDAVKANLYAVDEVLSKLKEEEQSILKKAMELYKKSDAYNGNAKLHDESKANKSSNYDSIDFKASEAFAEKLLAGESFKTIVQARKALTTQAIEAGTENAKKADEAIELAGVLAARKIVEQGMTESDTFDALVKLAEQMPSLNVRSSTSVSEQAYSTPLPLAYVASIRSGINKSTTVTEPTAGNGALLIAASPNHVVANELNKSRLESLKEQGFDALNKNAVDFNFGNKDSEVVIANPPFGAVKDDNGMSVTFKVNERYSTNEIDHAIAMNSLKSMRDDGKAVLIVGGPSKTLSEAARSDAYNGKAKRAFYKTLYDEYNVTDHFTVSGNLYAKQGAAWPVDVIIIDGRGKSSLRLPAADLPRIINTVSELKDELTANRKSVSEDTQSTEQGQRTGTAASDEGSGKNTDGKRDSGTDQNNGTSGVLPGLGNESKGNGQEPTANADEQHDQGSKGTNGANTSTGLTNDDLSNMFDDIVAEELDKRKPKEEVKQERSIGELSTSAVKNSAQGLSDAINGLGALFGGNGRLSSGLSFDEETYAKAKPLFLSAIEHMGNAAADIKEAMRAIVKMVMDQFGADAVTNMKPYVVAFINDIQSSAKSLTEKSKSATEAVNKFQAEYKPASLVPLIGSLVPVNMQNSIEGALENLKEKHGDVDSYVANLLDYDKKDISKYFSAEQVDAIGLALDNITNGKGFIIGDQTGIGKGRSQPLDSKVLTPTGWVKMGDVSIGSKVIAANGKSTTITQIHPQGVIDAYEIEFSDGSKTRASADHLWHTKTRNQRRESKINPSSTFGEYKTRTTSYLANHISQIHSVPLTEAVHFNETEVPLDPYLLGAILGDGCIRKTGDVQIVLAEQEMFDMVESTIPEHLTLNHRSRGTHYDIGVSGGLGKKSTKMPIIMRSLGLNSCVASSKFIPDIYKINSVEIRHSILQGLLDTDGTAQKNGSVIYYTVSKQLADDVVFIVGSLGGTTTRGIKKTTHQDCHCIYIKLPDQFNPFRLERKQNRVKNWDKYRPEKYIKKITHIGAVECQCITIEDDSHLYITDDFVVTHNCNAAMIRYAMLNKMTPIFVTEKPNLYGDMIRDLNDIGMPEIKPFATNAGFSIPIDEEAQNWYAANEKAKEDGEPSPARYGKFIKTDAAAKHTKAMNDMVSNGDIGKNDVIFTTYSQMQTVKGARTPRMDFLEELAKGGLLILDESHNAGGVATVKRGGGEEEKGGRAAVVRRIVNNAKGVFYSSATYAKRPDVLDLYSKTDMGLIADPKTLIEALQAGGVPLQQAVASMLAKAGQYIRREKSFDGIAYDTTEVEVDREFAENAAEMMRDIMTFDEMKGKAVASIKQELKNEAKLITPDRSSGKAGAESANFTSSMHNMISQMLLMLKVKPTIDETIAALKRGEKPVIALSNTMGAAIDEYVKEAGLLPGDAINLSFGDLLKRYLKKSRMVTETDAYGNKEKRELTDEELGVAATRYYNKLLKKIESTGFDKYPVSPIDAIHDALAKAGYKSGEITGRSSTIDYSGDAPVYKKRQSQQISPAGKRKTINDFNNGLLDVIILNQSGATGLSLHSSPKVGGDTRKRHMIIAQAELNIDTHMQMLGRVNRTGQLVLPSYSQLVANIPAEKRPAAILAKKMAMLNAQTTAGKDSAVKAKDVPDFMNDYGDIVAAAIMNENRDVHRKIGRPLSESMTTGLETEGAMRKVTGRIPVLPLKEQEQLYTIIEEAYNEYIDMLTKTGQNQLEAEAMALDAKTIASNTVVPQIGASNSPFAEGVNAETVDVKRLGKPFTLDQIKGLLAKAGITDSTSKYDFINNLKTKLKSAQDARLNEIDAMPEEDESDIARKTSHKTTLESQLKEIEYFINRYPPGSPVTLTSPQGVEYLGYVGNFERKGDAKNYFANGQWKATIFVADAAKQFVLPLTQISTSVDRDGTWKIDSASNNDVKEALEEGQSTSREQRTILTGNMLAAYGFNKTGQIINYTNDSSEVKQGVLMPKKFDLQTAIDAKPIIFASPDMAMEYLSLSDNPSYAIRSSDNSVRLIPQWNSSYKLYVPAPKSKGGMYYQNKRLVELLGDFYKTGKEMQVSISKANLEEALRIIYPISKAMQPVSKETGKKFLDDKGIKFSKSQAGESFAREALSALAKENEFFRYKVSDKDTLQGVMEDVFPTARYRGMDSKGRHIFALPTGSFKVYVGSDLNFKEQGVYNQAKKVWVDVSNIEKGSGGSAIYFALGNYAYNTDKIFIPDPLGLNDNSMIRRTANMLYLAIRFGTTRFMEPSIQQMDGDNEKGVAPLDWTGDDSQKTESLLNSFLTTLHKQLPGIKDARYNFDTRRFEDSEGLPLDKTAFDRIRETKLGEGAAGARAGATTTRQGILIQSLISRSSESRSALLGQLLRWNSELQGMGGLDRLFSKDKVDKANAHTEATLLQSMRGVMDKQYGNGWTDRLLATGKFKIVSRNESVEIGGKGATDAQGFYDPKTDTTYLVPENISKADNIKGLLLHEIGEHALQLGKNDAEYNDILKQISELRKTDKDVQAAFNRVPKDTRAGHVASEVAAYLVQHHPDLSVSQRIVAWFRSALRKIGSQLKGADKLKWVQWANNLNVTDIVSMANSALKSAPDSLSSNNANNSAELEQLRNTIEAYQNFIKCIAA